MKHIELAANAGFCFGVTNAVRRAEEELQKAAEERVPLYCLGQLIHNAAVTDDLQARGLITIGSIDEAPEGSRVFIRAHGEPDRTYEKAAEKRITLIDATCPFVGKIHSLAKEAQAQGRAFAVVGDENHPEVIGILGSTRLSAGAVQTADRAQALALQWKNRPLAIAAQTTVTREKFDTITGIFREQCTDLTVHDTICRATRDRQQGAALLAQNTDCMVVIGDKNSSNSQKLFEICRKYCNASFFIESFDDLDLKSCLKYNNIGVAAGASVPERIIKEVIANMSEVLTNELQNEEMIDMSAYMDEIEKSLKLPGRGEVVTGSVVAVTNDYVVINLGCKKDGMLPVAEVAKEEGQTLTEMFHEGDEVQAKVIKTDDGDGNILLSNRRMQSGENWEEINAFLDNKEVINVTVVKEVKGGVIATYKEVSGFIPMSQLADHYVETAAEYIGKTLPVKVTRVDAKRNKAVFSHKAFLTEEKNKMIAQIWDTLNVGDVVEGKVMRFTDYGAFVDIGGIDGLLHISEISWGKLKHPQEALEIGQTVNVKILSMNVEKGKISLGMKQNSPEPWSVIDEQYAEGQVITGKVVQIKEYGAFVELAPGLDGLVHISEVAHKRVNKISDELTIGQVVNAKILEIDKERKRISLSIKATIDNVEAVEEAAPVEE
ncbi:MAG: bifunctional 4-hydroxy-3-methylbut-2-enyl diphosphate reductase/30S ribosomal protein S1 [Firmicutes bacterium]|nr:bifunctional 4-hydroxy-3-methylbut-2-enyl diphosphate reductase/30S ribosomal protein S1 [Bacillota bacterium]